MNETQFCRYLAIAALSCFPLVACDNPFENERTEPVIMNVVLGGATKEDAAILLEIGPGATRVSSARKDIDVYSTNSSGHYIVAAFGSLDARPLLQIAVADEDASLNLQIHQIARLDGSLRKKLADYSLRVVRP